MARNYILVSGIVFGLVAIAQGARAIMQTPIQIGNFELPVFASWIAAVVAAILCFWAYKSRS